MKKKIQICSTQEYLHVLVLTARLTFKGTQLNLMKKLMSYSISVFL